MNPQLKYQTHNSNSGISPNDPTWDSLVFSQIFTIGKSQQVDFSITDTSDETCFTINDGFIKIQASGESGRTFLYQYLKNGIIQTIGGQSWLPFTNTNTAEINSLGLGSYRVRVRDSEGCLVK